MKTKSSIAKAVGAAKPLQAAAPWDQQSKLPIEPLDLTPERITDRAFTVTKLLSNMLERDEGRSHFHSGINE